VARSCERVAARPPEEYKGTKSRVQFVHKSSSKLGTLVDEEMRGRHGEACASRRLGKDGPYWYDVSLRRFGRTTPPSQSDAEASESHRASGRHLRVHRGMQKAQKAAKRGVPSAGNLPYSDKGVGVDTVARSVSRTRPR
jgi:hypothetical protein